MTPDRWQQLKQIFQSALERNPAERSAFLSQACAGDPALRSEVESLISSHDQAGDSIEAMAAEAATEMLEDDRAIVGKQIGHYEVLSRIGRGGMGEVFLAQDTNLGRKVALKLLRTDFTRDEDRLRRFRQEARAASALNHPNILTIYEISSEDSTHFMATEYVEGETLRQRMASASMKLSEALDVAIQVAGALAAAHQAGIVHRDIKPENIMVRRDSYAKVLDFGLAKLTERAPTSSDSAWATLGKVETNPGIVMGTVQYMSPEQARGLEVDARTDIFSLGVVLYEMVTGRVPFEGATNSDLIVSILEREPKLLARLSPPVPAELQRIISKALRKDREERYQVVKDLLLDLKSLKQELDFEAKLEQSVQPEFSGKASKRSDGKSAVEITEETAARTSALPAARPTSSAEYLVSEIKRRKLGALLSLATLVFAATVVGYLIYQRPKTPERPRQYSLARLTFDPGLQTEPTWSPDGRFIAYTSDRSGNFDIWVQQVGGGNPLQITHSPAHDWQPDWSPDGTNLVFRSEREGGGLFVVPVLGGLERKLCSFGYYPRWSPNGLKILFSDSSKPLPPVKVASKLYLATLDRNEPNEVLLPDFTVGFDGLRSVCWYPDSQRISFVGKHAKLGWGFWTVPIAGGAPVKSEVLPAVQKKLDEGLTYNFQWASSGTEIYFEGFFRGVTNLWKVVVDPATLSWVAGPERLTTGSGIDTEIALSRDGKRVAFCTRIETIRVWSLQFNARTGRIKGEGQPLTAPGIVPFSSDLSPDGKKLVFTAGRLGNEKRELWEKSLEDGAERLLTVRDNAHRDMEPRWSRDGTRISYKRVVPNLEHTDTKVEIHERLKFEIVILHVGSNDERVFTLEATTLVSDWSADGQWLLGVSDYQNRRHFSVCLIPLSATHAEKEMRVVASDPAHNFFAHDFSPDDRWISLNAVSTGASSTIYVVPWSGGEKIRITDGKYWSDKPRWSPDGKILYFVSNQTTGFFNVWGIHFEPQEGKPIGEPFQVTSYEDPGKMIWPSMNTMTLSVSEDRLVLPIQEVTGNIWMLETVDH